MLNYLYGVIAGSYGNIVYWSTGCCSNGYTQVTGTSSVDISSAAATMNANCSGGTVSNTQTGNYVDTSNIPSVTCSAPEITTFWATGCCSTNNLQVTGTSTSSSAAAITARDGNCPGGSISNGQTGSYTGASNVPAVNCAPPPPTCTPVCGAWSYTYGAWSGWSACSGGTQTRTRTVTGTRTCTASNCSTYTETSSSTETESQSCGTTWYCSYVFNNGFEEWEYGQFTSSIDQTGTAGCSSKTACSTAGYPAYPSPPC